MNVSTNNQVENFCVKDYKQRLPRIFTLPGCHSDTSIALIPLVIDSRISACRYTTSIYLDENYGCEINWHCKDMIHKFAVDLLPGEILESATMYMCLDNGVFAHIKTVLAPCYTGFTFFEYPINMCYFVPSMCYVEFKFKNVITELHPSKYPKKVYVESFVLNRPYRKEVMLSASRTFLKMFLQLSPKIVNV